MAAFAANDTILAFAATTLALVAAILLLTEVKSGGSAAVVCSELSGKRSTPPMPNVPTAIAGALNEMFVTIMLARRVFLTPTLSKLPLLAPPIKTLSSVPLVRFKL